MTIFWSGLELGTGLKGQREANEATYFIATKCLNPTTDVCLVLDPDTYEHIQKNYTNQPDVVYVKVIGFSSRTLHLYFTLLS